MRKIIFLISALVFLSGRTGALAESHNWPAAIVGNISVEDPETGHIGGLDGVKISLTDGGGVDASVPERYCKGLGGKYFVSVSSTENLPSPDGGFHQGWTGKPGRFAITGGGNAGNNSQAFASNPPSVFKATWGTGTDVCNTGGDRNYSNGSVTKDCGINCLCVNHTLNVFFPPDFPGLPDTLVQKGYSHTRGTWKAGSFSGFGQTPSCTGSGPEITCSPLEIGNDTTANINFTFTPDKPPGSTQAPPPQTSLSPSPATNIPSGCILLEDTDMSRSVTTLKLGNIDFYCPTPTPTATPSPAPESTCVSGNADITLVFDKTGSMGQPVNSKTKMDWAKDAVNSLVASVKDLNSNTVRLGLVSYDTSSYRNQELTTDYDKISKALAPLVPNGSTCISCGISQANSSGWAENARKVEILMSDGEANYPNDFTAKSEAINSANSGKQNGIQIYSIAYGYDADPPTMMNIASDPDSQYYRYAPDPAQLEEVYQEILKDICK